MDFKYAVSTDLLQQYVHQLLPHWHKDRIARFSYLEGGYNNANYRFSYLNQDYVLRVPQRTQPFIDHHHELQWYLALPEFISAKPIALDPSTGHMVSPWVNGKLLVEAWPDLQLQDLVVYLVKLHKKLPRTPRQYNLPQLTRRYLSRKGDVYAPYNPSADLLVPCHNDLNPWNIMVTDSGWITLDWEFAANNDPLFDLVSLHQGLGLPPMELTNFAELYLGRFTNADALRLRQAEHAFWLREMAWAHYQIKQGNDRAEIIAQEANALARLKLLEQP
jgi:aminoglycoside phosphotransferase (APT) family kinase protein